MPSFYASDAVVRHVQNGGHALSKAYYIYTEEEAAERFSGILDETNWIIRALPIILEIEGHITYAVSASQAPFQVVHLGNGSFVVLIGWQAFYFLYRLCLRTQSLGPLAQELDLLEINCEKDYGRMFLLDIVKDFTFNTDNFSHYLNRHQSNIVFEAAYTFIVGHEIAHASHGHLEFIASDDFQQFCSDESDRNFTLRTLEMDADCSGTTSVVDIFERYANIACKTLPAGMTPEALRLLIRKRYIAGMLIALLYLDALSSNFAPVAYPISYARFLAASKVAQITLSRMDADADSIPDLIRQRIASAFERLSGDISTLGHPIASNVMNIEDPDNPQYLYNHIGIAAGEDHLEPLLGRWARIRPFLEKYQRGGRLAPARVPPC